MPFPSLRLPHLVKGNTNLDGGEAMRAGFSLPIYEALFIGTRVYKDPFSFTTVY